LLGNTATTVKGAPPWPCARVHHAALVVLCYSCCSDRLAPASPAGSHPHTDRSSGAEIGAQSPAAARTMGMGHGPPTHRRRPPGTPLASGSPHLADGWSTDVHHSLPLSLSHPRRPWGKKDGGFAPLRAERRVKHGVPFPLPRVGNGEREREACLYVVALGLAGWDGLGITVYYRSKHLQAVRWCPRPGLEWDRWTTTTLLDRKHPHRAQETSQGMIRSSVTVSLTPST
jgi:hypothetical protein